MHREDDLIFFDEDDRKRYPGLEDFMPIEGIPALFEEMMDAKVKARAEIQGLNDNVNGKSYAENLAALQRAHLRCIRLSAITSDLAEHAGVELIEAMVPAITE